MDLEAEEEDSIISMAVATTTTVDGIYIFFTCIKLKTATGEGADWAGDLERVKLAIVANV